MKYWLLLFGLLTAQAHAASFDCAKAVNPDERAVCSDPQLSQLDDLTATAFGQAKVASPGDQEGSAVASARLACKTCRAYQASRSCVFNLVASADHSTEISRAKQPIPSWVSAKAAVSVDTR